MKRKQSEQHNYLLMLLVVGFQLSDTDRLVLKKVLALLLASGGVPLVTLFLPPEVKAAGFAPGEKQS